MKKILYIVTQPEFGGAQRYIFDLASNFKDTFDITVAAGSDFTPDSLLSRCESAGIKTYKFINLKREINLKTDFKAGREIFDYIIKEQPDIIHLNSSKAGVLGSIAVYFAKSKIKPSKIVYTVHGWAFLEPVSTKTKLLYLWAEKFSARFRDTLIVLSQKECDVTLNKRLSHPSKINIIPHGIDYGAMSFYIREKSRNLLGEKLGNIKFSDEDFIVGAVANFYPTKGIEFLARAAAQMPKIFNNRKIFFIIIGDGRERAKLELLIKKYRLQDNFYLAGAIPEAYKLFYAFDVFALPSVKEGFPYVILEAMAAGTPIIATGVGGIPEIINNNFSGILVPPQNPDALKNALMEFLSSSSKRKSCGEAAQKILRENYGIEKMLRTTSELYNKL